VADLSGGQNALAGVGGKAVEKGHGASSMKKGAAARSRWLPIKGEPEERGRQCMKAQAVPHEGRSAVGGSGKC